MTTLARYTGSDTDPSKEIIQQQNLMAQLLQLGQQAQQKLAIRQEEHSDKIHKLEKALFVAQEAIREQQNNYRLITANMLDTMLDAGWNEKTKNKMGVDLAKFSRACNVAPTKVPHPTLPNGVNGYEPGVVKAWLEKNGYSVPSELRYVD